MSLAPQSQSDVHIAAPSAEEFARIARKVETCAGIILEARKHGMVHSRLRRRLIALGLSDFTDYLDYLDSDNGKQEVQHFINAITTNLTSFFRERHHFQHLAEQVILPSREAGKERLRIWSAGCSTGEEPYSIALTIAQKLNTIPPDYKILATDIDTMVLKRAQEGIYNNDPASSQLEEYRRFFIVSDDKQNVRIRPEVASAISFRSLNLLNPWPFSGVFDVIFCRNTMIYFSDEAKKRLMDQFIDRLEPGGIMYLGHSEPMLGVHPSLISLGSTIYQKVA